MIRAMMIIGTVAFFVGLIIYALIDCLRTEHERVRVLPKPLWAIIVVLFPVVGALLWLVFGKHRAVSSFDPVQPAQTPRAPDDDDEYLRFLNAKTRREADSRRRSQEQEDELDRKVDEELQKIRESKQQPGVQGPNSENTERKDSQDKGEGLDDHGSQRPE